MLFLRSMSPCSRSAHINFSTNKEYPIPQTPRFQSLTFKPALSDVVNCLSSDFSPMFTQFRFATLRWHCRVSLQWCSSQLFSSFLAVETVAIFLLSESPFPPARSQRLSLLPDRFGCSCSLSRCSARSSPPIPRVVGVTAPTHLHRYIDGVCVLALNRRCSVQSLGMLVSVRFCVLSLFALLSCCSRSVCGGQYLCTSARRSSAFGDFAV